MRAARLLRMLLLLQNCGRMTSRQLAGELEVTPRTILRDVDALTEAGLPVIVHRGHRGGIELGFNYRSRLTGLDRDEAEALAIMLNYPVPELSALGLDAAASAPGPKCSSRFYTPCARESTGRHAGISLARQALLPTMSAFTHWRVPYGFAQWSGYGTLGQRRRALSIPSLCGGAGDAGGWSTV